MCYLRSNLFISKTPLLSACNFVFHLKSFLNICWCEQTDHIFILCMNNIGHTISYILNAWHVLFEYDCIYVLCVIFPNILYCLFLFLWHKPHAGTLSSAWPTQALLVTEKGHLTLVRAEVGASIPHSSSAGETTEEFPFSFRTWKSSKSSGTLLLFKWILSRRFKLIPLKLDVPLCALPERSIFSWNFFSDAILTRAP